MKVYKEEIEILNQYFKDNESYPVFTHSQKEELKESIYKIRKEAKNKSLKHFFLQLLPYLLIGLQWSWLLFKLPLIVEDKLLLGLLLGIGHGIIGYQWVIYGMHEGAGHGLFKGKNLLEKSLRFLSFHSCRIFFADPRFYFKAHITHHSKLGTIEDKAQTNYVLNKRVVRSMLPGAGILFPNDYCIHKGESFSKSELVSIIVGGLFLFLEVQILKSYLSWWQVLISLVIIGPWIGLVLDRTRESLEHHLMPVNNMYGTYELGLSPLSLFISGGPWGQPCHFCHHLAPDFNWYQQIILHFKVKKLLTEEQMYFYGFKKDSFIKMAYKKFESRVEVFNKYTTQEGIK